MRRLHASSMKCAPFWDDSAKRMPAVREDPDWEALDPRKAADEGGAVERLELVKAAPVDDPCDELERVELVPEVLRDEPVQVGRIGDGRLRRCQLPRQRRRVAEVSDDLPREGERVLVGGRVVVGDTRATRVDVGAAELLGGHLLARRGLHERWAADEDRPGAAHDDRLVRHRRHVGAACRARPHHDSDLRNALGRHARLVVEDPPEVLAVGEDLVLQREEGAARVDEVEARQVVLLGDLLRAEVLLHGQREVRAALHGRVVGDDHARAAFDDPDPGHDPRRGRLAVVDVPGGECVQLEERRARVDESVDSLARGQLAAGAVALERALAAARGNERRPVAELVDELRHPLRPTVEALVARDAARDHGHPDSSSTRSAPVVTWSPTATSTDRTPPP